jgi:hypothetical protein
MAVGKSKKSVILLKMVQIALGKAENHWYKEWKNGAKKSEKIGDVIKWQQWL